MKALSYAIAAAVFATITIVIVNLIVPLGGLSVWLLAAILFPPTTMLTEISQRVIHDYRAGLLDQAKKAIIERLPSNLIMIVSFLLATWEMNTAWGRHLATIHLILPGLLTWIVIYTIWEFRDPIEDILIDIGVIRRPTAGWPSHT